MMPFQRRVSSKNLSVFSLLRNGILNQVIEHSVAYIQGWLDVLRNDIFLVFKASGEAQKAVGHILN
jgi:antirestriction protein ArdC